MMVRSAYSISGTSIPSCRRCGRTTGSSLNGLCRACFGATGTNPTRRERSVGSGVGGRCCACGRAWRHVRLVSGRCPGGCDAASAQRTPTAKAPTARDPWKAYEAEARAMAEGKRLGALHAGDPWKAARALGVTVLDGDPAVMADNGNDAWSLRNPARPEGPHLVCLSSGLHGDERDRVLAHELAHVSLGRDASERDCDAFADELLRQRPETPREMARRIEEAGLALERALARHRALEQRR
jgi:hypothetical protein